MSESTRVQIDQLYNRWEVKKLITRTIVADVHVRMLKTQQLPLINSMVTIPDEESISKCNSGLSGCDLVSSYD